MTKIPFNIKDRKTAYYFLKKDFLSAYNANGHKIELAINQVANLRDLQPTYVRSILDDYIKILLKKNYFR